LCKQSTISWQHRTGFTEFGRGRDQGKLRRCCRR